MRGTLARVGWNDLLGGVLRYKYALQHFLFGCLLLLIFTAI